MTALVALIALAAIDPAPITLDEALDEAARANSDLLLTRADADRAATDTYASYAGVLPRLDLNASFGHDFAGAQRIVTTLPTPVVNTSGQITGLTFSQQIVSLPATDNADYLLGLAFDLPLFDGLRSWNAVEEAKESERAARHAVDETLLSTAFETTRRFFEVLKAQESLRVLEETVARSAEILSRAEALFEAGRGGRLDVLTAQGNLGRDRISVTQGEAQLEGSRADLATILGRDATAPLSVVPPSSVAGPSAPALEEPASSKDLFALARKARPLLAERAASAEAARVGETVAHAAWFPVVDARASYNREGPTLAGSEGVYGDPTQQYTATAQVVVQWNVFNGRQTLADEERAAIAHRRALTLADQAVQQVSAEIAKARANLVSLGRAAVLAEDNLRAAEQGVKLAEDRLEAGLASQLEMRDASLKLTQARLDLLNTRIDAVVARADLARAVGGRL
jgi:outer membrane protein